MIAHPLIGFAAIILALVLGTATSFTAYRHK